LKHNFCCLNIIFAGQPVIFAGESTLFAVDQRTLRSQEVMCCEAMAESISRKEKVSGELQETVAGGW
jgi:hypothetical protein